MCKTKSRASVVGIFGVVLILVLLYVRNPPNDLLSWLVSTLSDALQVMLLLAPAIAVFGCIVLGRVARWARPKAGNRPLPSDVVKGLQRAFELDRNLIASSMVPAHQAQAEPARSSRSISLGDAAYTLSRNQSKLLKNFIGEPKRSSRLGIDESRILERDVVIVTGEPGSGKSVLVQEIHASLCAGVECGNHALIPVFVFARDIRLRDLLEVMHEQDPMKRFLAAYYEERIRTQPTEADLRALHTQIQGNWHKLDFLVIIDGLDEIPQRSSYESIQRNLMSMVAKDLSQTPRGVAHRYILSCRVDEDIEVFQGAQVLRLKGLTDRQREQFCQAQINQSNLNKHDQVELRRVLQSPRLVPSHVFRRNPYFLALLVEYFKETRSSVRDEYLDFDFLMQKYLEREARRPHVATKDSSPRQLLPIAIQQLKVTSTPFLQSIAFRSAVSPNAGSLYGEIRLDKSAIEMFLGDVFAESELGKGSTSQDYVMWNRLRVFLKACADNQLSDSRIDDDALRPNDYLTSDSIACVRSASSKLAMDGRLDAKTVMDALDDLVKDERLEERTWYYDLAARYVAIVQGLNLDKAKILACIFLLRSVVAAHTLRVIYLRQQGDDIALRFRHRRLAEYFAACYCRDRWSIAPQVLQPLPWLGPMLNLVCALQRSRYSALEWLVDQIDDKPTEPLHKWRYSVEIACEAISFAGVGGEYDALFSKLVTKVLRPLSPGKAVFDSTTKERASISSFAVTAIVLHRKLAHLSSVAATVKRTVDIDETTVGTFYRLASHVGPEWLPYYRSSCVALEKLSGVTYPLRHQLKTLWRFITYPAALLFPTERNGDNLQVLRRTVLGTTVLGEMLFWVAWFGFLLVVSRYLDALASPDAGFWQELFEIVAVFLVALSIVQRLFSYMRTPTKAVMQSSLPWRWLPRTLLFSVSVAATAYVVKNTIGRFIRMEVVVLMIWAAAVVLIFLFSWTVIRKKGFLNVVKSVIMGIAYLAFCLALGALCVGGSLLIVSVFPPDPSPNFQSPAISEEELERMEELVRSQVPTAPPFDIKGNLEALLVEREISHRISAIKAARRTLGIVHETGDGPALPREPATTNIEKPPIARTTAQANNARITELAAKLAQTQVDLEQARDNLRPRNRRLLIRTIAVTTVFLALSILMRLFYQAEQDRKHISEMSKIRSIGQLLKYAENDSLSERVRRKALRVIDSIERFDDTDIRLVETSADTIHQRSNQTERQFGTEVASLAERMSTRLRYRAATGTLPNES